jgi:hypothetical protein
MAEVRLITRQKGERDRTRGRSETEHVEEVRQNTWQRLDRPRGSGQRDNVSEVRQTTWLRSERQNRRQW